MIPFIEINPDNAKELVAYGTAATILGGLAVKALHKVEQGERGVRTRYGKTHRTRGRRKGEPYGVLKPGLHVTIPLTHSIKNTNVKDRTSQLKDALFTQGSQFWKADISVTWAVMKNDENPIKALFNVEPGELDDTVKEICSDGLDQVLLGYKEKTIEDFSVVKKDAIEICNEGLNNYGVAVKRFNIYNPTPREAEIVSQALAIGGLALGQIREGESSQGEGWSGFRAG